VPNTNTLGRHGAFGEEFPIAASDGWMAWPLRLHHTCRCRTSITRLVHIRQRGLLRPASASLRDWLLRQHHPKSKVPRYRRCDWLSGGCRVKLLNSVTSCGGLLHIERRKMDFSLRCALRDGGFESTLSFSRKMLPLLDNSHCGN
jgi:hypothetical protein